MFQETSGIIERLDKGYDGLIRAAHILTSTGRTNRLITRLHSLEVTDHQTMEHVSTKRKLIVTLICQRKISTRPRREAARGHVNNLLSAFVHSGVSRIDR